MQEKCDFACEIEGNKVRLFIDNFKFCLTEARPPVVRPVSSCLSLQVAQEALAAVSCLYKAASQIANQRGIIELDQVQFSPLPLFGPQKSWLFLPIPPLFEVWETVMPLRLLLHTLQTCAKSDLTDSPVPP